MPAYWLLATLEEPGQRPEGHALGEGVAQHERLVGALLEDDDQGEDETDDESTDDADEPETDHGARDTDGDGEDGVERRLLNDVVDGERAVVGRRRRHRAAAPAEHATRAGHAGRGGAEPRIPTR